MYGSLDVAVSGMVVQRVRMEVATANIANQNAVKDANGRINPYRRREVYIAAGDPRAKTAEARHFGVHIAGIGLDPTPFQPRVYDPTNPDAYKDGPNKGYLPGTNVNPLVELTNQMEAERAYEACATAAETTKTMMAQALRLLA